MGGAVEDVREAARNSTRTWGGRKSKAKRASRESSVSERGSASLWGDVVQVAVKHKKHDEFSEWNDLLAGALRAVNPRLTHL